MRSNFLFVYLLIAAAGWSQGLSNGSLTGRYYFRHLQATGAQGAVQEARTLSGAITFDGNGGYTFAGQQVIQAGAAAALSGSGTYSVASTGILTLSSPQRAGVTMNGRMSEAAVAASSTEAGGGLYDLLIAFPAPAAGTTNASLNGAWWVAGIAFPGADARQARSAFFSLAANAGAFANVTVNGQAANLGTRVVTQTVTGGAYTLAADGSGTGTFPLPAGASAAARLIGGAKALHLSRDGNFFLLGSSEAGGHELLVGIRAPAVAAGNTTLRDLYYSAGMKLDSDRFNSHAGSANATGSGVALLSRRVRVPEGVTDFSGINRYSIQADGSGLAEIYRFAVGAGGNAYVGSGVSLTDSNNYELYFGFRAPAVTTGAGVFLHPYGAVNAASFAPVGNPLAGGAFATLFGAGLAPRTQTASSLPFPTNLAGVEVLVNDRAAPLYLVSAGQVSFLVPQSTAPGTATIVVNNGGVRSNVIQAPVGATSPGIFSLAQSGFGPGAILKTNFTVVSAANPVRRGDTVQIYLTGLGAVTPALADGAAAPSAPLSLVNAAVNVYIGGVAAQVTFKGLAPGFAGLYQVNAVVPSGAPGGANVPLAIETPDAFHDQVDIAVVP